MQKSYVTAVFDRKNQVKTRGVGKVEIYVYLRRDQKKYITIKTCTESEWKFFQHSVTLASEISMYSSIIAEMEENEEEMLMFNFEKRLGMDANSRENLEKARIASSPTSFLDFMMTEIEKEKIAPGTKKRKEVTWRAMKEWGKMNRFAQVTVASVLEFDEWLHQSADRTSVTIHN